MAPRAALHAAPSQSAHLGRSRSGAKVREPTIPEKAALRAAARNLDPGTSSSPVAPCSSGSRFAILDRVPLEHFADIALECDIVFRGERGPRLEQISAIRAKESFDGALAEA